MSKIKIFNDPIYGLVSYPYEFIYELIDHPYFQRLRRIQQLGMSSIVYPGATHTRFHHALGALHLCDRLISNLKLKGITITPEEHEATLIAILLHDIGHGPYSHALEHELIPVHHEVLTLRIMEALNQEFDHKLDLALAIFKKEYHKDFLSQMISGQLDVDRMDYLNRDSFYTGVAEGIIGYDRIIKMMDVRDNQLVVEEKGIQSVEKFLLSRYFMYQQVYLHKAALTADHMLKLFFNEYKAILPEIGTHIFPDTPLIRLIRSNKEQVDAAEQLQLFLEIDDSDIITLLKSCLRSGDVVLRNLSSGLINRKLFGVTTKDSPFSTDDIEAIVRNGAKLTGLGIHNYSKLVNLGKEKSALYERKDEILILQKNGDSVVTFGNISRLNSYQGDEPLYFMTYPKVIV